MTNKCIVQGCLNHKHQGSFSGDLCMPCHNMLTSGEVKYGKTFIHGLRDRIEELEEKLEKAEALQEAQKLFNLYAVQVLMLGATVSRLENLESAWINLKTQAELTGGKDDNP